MYGRGSRVRRSVVCTRDRVAGGGYACGARPELHTVCRSFPKISSALSTKVCGGSKSAKNDTRSILIDCGGVAARLQLCPCFPPGPVPRVSPSRRAGAWRSKRGTVKRVLTCARTKRPKDKSMCARRDAIAQRSSPGLASNRATAPGSGANRPSVTIRPPIPTPVQLVSPI